MNNELLQQVRILDPVSQTDQIADVLLVDNEIKEIQTQLTEIPQGTKIIDSRGLILAPGLVDIYSHSGEPGYEERETLSTLLAAAAAGGFTRLAILPDTVPSIDIPAGVMSLHQQQQKVTVSPSPHLYIWGALTVNLKGEKMTELADLAKVGVIGFTDGYPLSNLSLLRRLLEYLQPLGKPIAIMATDSQIKGNGVMREGVASIRYGLPGNPGVSEAVAIAALLEIVAEIKTPVHLMRISTRRGVELIAQAKGRGLPVTASTTWMHLLLNTDAIANYNPNLHLEPPLGNRTDMVALIKGVKEGIIDAIAIDHTPYTYEEKTVSFAKSPPGVIGLELALPLLWETFVATQEWSALQLWQALSTNPQLCLQQQPHSCIPGQTAELVLFDPQKGWIVEENSLKSLSSNTPWLGKHLKGKVLRIWN